LLTLFKICTIWALQNTKRIPCEPESHPRIEPGNSGIPSQFLTNTPSYLVVTVCITRFNVIKYILTNKCIYVFGMDLGTNYDNFLIQHVSSNRGYI